jgi:hypothetical protein
MIRTAKRVHVYVDPQRDLHGPAVVRTACGDLLLCHQDSQRHLSGRLLRFRQAPRCRTTFLPARHFLR